MRQPRNLALNNSKKKVVKEAGWDFSSQKVRRLSPPPDTQGVVRPPTPKHFIHHLFIC